MPELHPLPDIPEGIVSTPWDSVIFGIPTFEITEPKKELLVWSAGHKGHFTLRIPSENRKSDIERYGFYYCDTLVEPHCKKSSFRGHHHPTSEISVSSKYDLDAILDQSRHLFGHDRFHKDPNVRPEDADIRYLNWIGDLHKGSHLYAFFVDGILAGFWSSIENKIPLHAIFNAFSGKRIAKYLWTQGCILLFNTGYDEIYSSVSVSNQPVINLYTSLGFRFYAPLDVYHLYNA